MNNVAFIVATGLVAAAASATPLGIGGSVSPIPVFPNSLLSATQVSAVNTSLFSSPGGFFTGQLNSQVFTNVADNPWGLNALSFGYVIFNNDTSLHALNRFTVNGFGTFLTDVGSDPFTAVPGYTDAFENNRPFASELGWSFIDANVGPTDYDRMNPGATSRIFIVHTNATTYNLSTAAVINGDIANATAWAPLPTPGAGALLGLGTLAAFRRRR